MKPFMGHVMLLMLCASSALVAAQVQAQAPASVYTPIKGKQCKMMRVHQDSGATTHLCPGVAGFRLQVEDDDARMSITVIDPQGKKHPLHYWHVVTSAFSSLGDKAEWYVARRHGTEVPMALIVRVNASENAATREKITAYLAVAKITGQQICVTAKITPGATQNDEARRVATASGKRPCL